MSCTIKEESLGNLSSYWHGLENDLDWPAVFVLPPWLEAWWQVFGTGARLYLRTVRQGDNVLGIAPLMRKGDTTSFVGDIEVCDYLDFIIAPGREEDFCNCLLDGLAQDGVRQLELAHVRPDSTVMRSLVPLAAAHGDECITALEDVSMEMALPPTWEEYLGALSAKQRHEIRRKMRRLQEAGDVQYRQVQDEASAPGAIETFFKMFTESRRDKAVFLTEEREIFFRRLAVNMEEAGLLRLGMLELDVRPVAQIICFDYNNSIYLYNSGYDPDYVSLSVGLLSKLLAVKDSIVKGRRKFDFLKGAEIYKYHLGGREVPLYRCLINIK